MKRFQKNLTSDDIYNVGEKIFYNVHSLVMNLFLLMQQTPLQDMKNIMNLIIKMKN